MTSLLFEDAVPDFPRGGASSLSRKEREDIRAEAEAEFNNEERGFKRKRNILRKHRVDDTEEDAGSLFGDGIRGKLPRFANRITLKNVAPGMKLWGVVSDVNEKDIEVSLPGGLRGLVRASDAFEPDLNNEERDGSLLPNLFHVGQFVACVVLQLADEKEKGKRKIWLSLRLSLLHKGFSFDSIQTGMVLTGSVKSIEDHGYILHFGIKSCSGFLPKAKQSACREVLRTRQLVQAVVTKIDKTQKVLHMSSDTDTVSKYVTKELEGISMDLLVPGMMVDARVKAVLENGVMLSFLTYFTGTVDMFHLQSTLPSMTWKDVYSPNKKVPARILFIDPSSRAIGLSLNPDLVHNKAPVSDVKIGEIYDHAKVVRVDKKLGVLFEIPSSPHPTPAHVNTSDMDEEVARKLEKNFKEGSQHSVRILGFRLLEGLAVGSLKASALEGSVFTHSDVKPGMVVKAKVIVVDIFGAIVQFCEGVKALCPLRHMSEFEIAKPSKKFKVGAELVFRVLGCKSKRITVTHKKTLVKSKLSILSSYTDATDGLVTHGWITKIEKHGCFVHFYNGVQGFSPRSELGLEPQCDPSSMYHVGQVVKCRVTSSVPASRRINLSFIIKPTRVSEDEIIKLGSLVSGVVVKITPPVVVVSVNVKGHLKGTILAEHLADHQGHVDLMISVLKPGYEFNELLVLDFEGNNLVLSAKYSLINSARSLPLDLSQIRPNSIIQGYICNVIETGCFVRYLGRLTGFCPRNKAMDDHNANLAEAFYIGQSVRSNVLEVNHETGRITVSLRQSCCSSTDASFIQELFLTEEKIANLQFSTSKQSEINWVEQFEIGSIVKGKVQEAKEFGIVVNFENCNNVFGFIAHYQLGGMTLETGIPVKAVVLDVAKAERVVDLSLKPEFVNKPREKSSVHTHKKKRKREAKKDLEVHQVVNGIVEIVKDEYMVLSLPEYDYTIGYASLADYNTQKLCLKSFLNGQSVVATVMALPSPSTAGRLLLLLESLSKPTETSSSKRAKKKSSYDVGSIVQAEITETKPLELRLKFGIGFRGRLHVTEVNEDTLMENPLCNFRIGQTLTTRIVEKAGKVDHNKMHHQWELSIKPEVLAGEKIPDKDFNFSVGQYITGYVYKVDKDWVWLAISRHVNAHLFILDSSSEPNELQEFQKQYSVGKVISGYVLTINREKKLLRMVLQPLTSLSNKSVQNKISDVDDIPDSTGGGNNTAHIHEGDIVGGRISKILPGVGGLLVQVGPYVHGRVHFTELTDSWEPMPLSGYYEGQYIKCKVLEFSRSIKGTSHVDLSLRSSLEGMHNQSAPDLCNNLQTSTGRIEKIEELQPDMVVQGYVKNITSKGCFISLSRKLDAKILLSNLVDGFVENLEKDFPVGKLVIGRVVSVEPMSKRVEVTLKTKNAGSAANSKIIDFSSLQVGEIVSGRIKRVESYGLFITIGSTTIVGLCHVSEISDDQIDNIKGKFKAGDRVIAKILKVDSERHRVSLGMKNSYIENNGDVQFPSVEVSDEDDDSSLDGRSDSSPNNNLLKQVLEEHQVLEQVESRASIPPLEVNLDDMDQSDIETAVTQQEHVNNTESNNQKDMRRGKRKAKEEREREITLAEERMLEKDVPRTADEFEKLIRSSPNSSFVWIKYMAFMLSLGDVEKARSIAERALRTINLREEDEKLNIWVAYFNLENEYGNPPEEAVSKILQRALQYCDPKKVHIALLGMYERTEQHKLTDDLLKKMIKKFKHSCKVWLRRIQRVLRQHQDEVQPVVSRALLSLPRHKHIKFISQTAILEFKCGVPDRGRSLFENVLREYPKRTDLWSIYIDQEIRLGEVAMIRSLFERAISLSLPPKKMKFLFKKYLEYEKTIGEEDRIKYVKQKAMEYVESTLA